MPVAFDVLTQHIVDELGHFYALSGHRPGHQLLSLWGCPCPSGLQELLYFLVQIDGEIEPSIFAVKLATLGF